MYFLSWADPHCDNALNYCIHKSAEAKYWEKKKVCILSFNISKWIRGHFWLFPWSAGLSHPLPYVIICLLANLTQHFKQHNTNNFWRLYWIIKKENYVVLFWKFALFYEVRFLGTYSSIGGCSPHSTVGWVAYAFLFEGVFSKKSFGDWGRLCVNSEEE